MENIKSRNVLSVLVIVAMIATMFAIPALDDDNQVMAASKKKTYKVKFNANGGKFAKKAKKTKKVTKGKKYGKLPKVTKSDAVFKGWYTKKVGGKKITSKTKVKSKKKHTLYAQWAAEYTIDSVAVNSLRKAPAAIPVRLEDGFVVEPIGPDSAESYTYPSRNFIFEKGICTGVQSDVRTMIPEFNGISLPVDKLFKKLGLSYSLVHTFTDNPHANKIYMAKVNNDYLYVSATENGNVFYSSTCVLTSVAEEFSRS